jgi:hypothetical protein
MEVLMKKLVTISKLTLLAALAVSSIALASKRSADNQGDNPTKAVRFTDPTDQQTPAGKTITLVSSEDQSFDLSHDLAMLSGTIKKILGDSAEANQNFPLENISSATIQNLIPCLEIIHAANGNQAAIKTELSAFITNLSPNELTDLMNAAKFLDIKPLHDTIFRIIALHNHISSEAIREMTHEDQDDLARTIAMSIEHLGSEQINKKAAAETVDQICVFCQDTMNPGQARTQLNCHESHAFHTITHKNMKCPLCKKIFGPKEVIPQEQNLDARIARIVYENPQIGSILGNQINRIATLKRFLSHVNLDRTKLAILCNLLFIFPETFIAYPKFILDYFLGFVCNYPYVNGFIKAFIFAKVVECLQKAPAGELIERIIQQVEVMEIIHPAAIANNPQEEAVEEEAVEEFHEKD